jgi:hypothetical protein
VGYDRPNVIHAAALPGGRSKAQKLDQWFDPGAFDDAQLGHYGNAGRNILRAPGLLTWDLSLQKEFPLSGERRRLQFRTDFFNVMNHANFDAPNASLASPDTMGVISSTKTGGRIIQLALHLDF